MSNSFKTLEINQDEHIAVLKLSRDKANAINAEMVQELADAIRDLEADKEVKGVVLTGQSPIFSVGLDVVELYSYDKDSMDKFWLNFAAAVSSLYRFSKPLVCSISGHSPAGGCVFALCADYRIMQEGAFKIGLNETAVSIVVPKPIERLYASVIGESQAQKFLMRAAMLSPEQAKVSGLVDEICSEEEMMTSAKARINKYLSLPQTAWKISKRLLRSDLAEILEDANGEGYAETANFWWEDESRAIIKALIEQLKGKKQ